MPVSLSNVHSDRPLGTGPRLRGAAGSELILLHTHCSPIVACPHDYAFDHECEPDAIVQKHRPVDEGFDNLPREKGFGGRKKKTLAADIQALAENDPVQQESRFDPPALYRQPQ